MDRISPQGPGCESLHLVANVDWVPEHEALQTVRMLFKFAVARARAGRLRALGRQAEVVVESTTEPPESLLEYLRSCGVAVYVCDEHGMAWHQAQGRCGLFPNLAHGAPDIAGLMSALATSFAQTYGLESPANLESLDRVESIVYTTRRRALVYGAAVGSDPDLQLLASAYVGEAVRRRLGGSWVYDPMQDSREPICLTTGGELVNVLAMVGSEIGPQDSDGVPTVQPGSPTPFDLTVRVTH